MFDGFYTGRRGRLLRWFDRRFRRDILVRFARTFEGFGDLRGRTVLDIGCGTGPYIVEALKRGARLVTGLDPAPAMLELVRDRLKGTDYADRCRLVEGSFPGTDLEPHDHAVVMGVMDYVADAATFIRTLRPLVRISAAVSFPSRHWLRTPLRRLRYRLRRCPLHLYDEVGIRRLFDAAGFSGIDLWKIPGAGMDYHVLTHP
ncbi:class I SAM-dependent methyltransferase [bacterium]|nr:class I SAM-dependent methyltransferase [bacterium]